MEAVITAGLSEAHSIPLSKSFPNCLIKVEGKSILERQIHSLYVCGVQRVTVVAGRNGDKIQEHVRQLSFEGVTLRVMGNQQYESTGSAFFFLYGLLGIDDDIIFIDEGVLYETGAIHKLAEASKHATLGVRKAPLSEGGFLVSVHNQYVTEIGKNKDKTDLAGEFIGIAKVPRSSLLDLRCKLHTLMQSPSKQGIDFAEAIQAAIVHHKKVEWMDLTEFAGSPIRSQKDLKQIRSVWDRL